MESNDADYTITLPSDKIAEVMEAWFNKVMFRRKVKVIDLKMANDLCMFSLAEVSSLPEPEIDSDVFARSIRSVPFVPDGTYDLYGSMGDGKPVLIEKDVHIINNSRDSKGRFTQRKCLCTVSENANELALINQKCPLHGFTGALP